MGFGVGGRRAPQLNTLKGPGSTGQGGRKVGDRRQRAEDRGRGQKSEGTPVEHPVGTGSTG